jgi:ribose 5-phosphate isomerase RpiB
MAEGESKTVVMGSDKPGRAIKDYIKKGLMVKGYTVLDVGVSPDPTDSYFITEEVCKTMKKYKVKGIVVSGHSYEVKTTSLIFSGIYFAYPINTGEAIKWRMNKSNLLYLNRSRRMDALGIAMAWLGEG